ncbi:MFS transporter [Corynebacterium sp. zg-331]|uniref:MDR family MFS transporter n=1 Tax=unclassified Corynebacterium TaxID=2624378 RepID=UPI00128D7F19|nr:MULTISPECIES: MDR family MFS transporter [unclassified Corynebacterium]MBC3186746.1 MFS transporter [Corynebacterium sp. zg-331]MPV53228.1 DHA2 family efflux MFS transporter permease subunit [Corynebacterium sp. zg331]
MTIQETTQERQQRLPWIIGALMLAMLMSSLGQMIFSTALPTIVGDLGGVNHMTWVITGFLLGQTIALPIFGKLGDQIGRKGLFLFANALFVLGSLVGGLAQSMSMLIVARVLQGIAGGGMMILSQAITAEVTTPRERGKYMGVMGSVFGISAVLGPILGGWFTDGVGWRWGLWLNVPIGVLAIAAISVLLQLPPKPKRLNFDWLGMVTMAIATAALVLFMTWGGNEYEWGSPMILGLIATAVIVGALFVFVETRALDPLVPMSLLKNRNFVLTTVAGFGIGVFMFGSLAYLPTYLQMVHGMSPTRAGLMLLCMMVGLMGTSIVVGNLVSTFGRYKAFPIVGLLIVAVAMTLLSTLRADSSLVIVGIYMFCFGFGMGCSMQILVLIVQNSFPVGMVGTVTATNNFFRQIGGSVGSALVGGLFVGNLTTQLQRNLPGGQQLSSGATSHLTPSALSSLPEPLRQAIEVSYNDALTPIFLLLMPLAVLCSALLWWVKEDKLKETIS